MPSEPDPIGSGETRIEESVSGEELCSALRYRDIALAPHSPLAEIAPDLVSDAPELGDASPSPLGRCLQVLACPECACILRVALETGQGESVYFRCDGLEWVGFWRLDEDSYHLRGPLTSSEMMAMLLELAQTESRRPPASLGEPLPSDEMALLLVLVEAARRRRIATLESPGSGDPALLEPSEIQRIAAEEGDSRSVVSLALKLLPEGILQMPEGLGQAVSRLDRRGLVKREDRNLRVCDAILVCAQDLITPLPAFSVMSMSLTENPVKGCHVFFAGQSPWVLEVTGPNQLVWANVPGRATALILRPHVFGPETAKASAADSAQVAPEHKPELGCEESRPEQETGSTVVQDLAPSAEPCPSPSSNEPASPHPGPAVEDFESRAPSVAGAKNERSPLLAIGSVLALVFVGLLGYKLVKDAQTSDRTAGVAPPGFEKQAHSETEPKSDSNRGEIIDPVALLTPETSTASAVVDSDRTGGTTSAPTQVPPDAIPVTPAQPPPASKVVFRGQSAWSANDREDTLTLKLGGFENLGNATSGKLRVGLWASKNSFRNGSTAGGFRLGGMDLLPLKAGESRDPVERIVAFLPPPDGAYYTQLSLYEGGKVVDYVSFEGTTTMVRQEILFSGGFGFTTFPAQGQIELNIDALSNRRAGGESGTLLLQVWLSRKPPDTPPEENRTYLVAEAEVGQLKGAHSFQNFRQYLRFSAPPPGKYWVVVAVSEYDRGEFGFCDRLVSDKAFKF